MAVIQVWVGGTRRSTVKQTNVPDWWRRSWVCGAHRYTNQAWTHGKPCQSAVSLTNILHGSPRLEPVSHREAAVVCRSSPSEGWQWEQRETESEVTLTSAPAACGAPAVWGHRSPERCSAAGRADFAAPQAALPVPPGDLQPRTGNLREDSHSCWRTLDESFG